MNFQPLPRCPVTRGEMTLAILRLNQAPEDPVVGIVRLLVRYQEDDPAHSLPPADLRPARDDLHEGIDTFGFESYDAFIADLINFGLLA